MFCREVAKAIRRLRELTNEFTGQFGDELKALDEINPRKILSDMVDPSKPLPGEKIAPAPNASAENKALTPPKPGRTEIAGNRQRHPQQQGRHRCSACYQGCQRSRGSQNRRSQGRGSQFLART